MEIKHREGKEKGLFTAFVDGKKAGQVTYVWAGEDKFIIDHTLVLEGFEGQGIGKKLVMACVDFARKNGKKIVPLCTYAQMIFKRNTEELKDVTA